MLIKFLVSVILIMIGSYAASMYFPWWSIAIIAFGVAAFIYQGPGLSFLAGFLGLFLLWFILSFYMSLSNDHVLASRISMLILKADNSLLLILITSLIGGITGGIAAMSGSYFRGLLTRPGSL